MHETHRVAARGERAAARDGRRQAALEECRVDLLGRIERPHARADLRGRAVRGAREERAVVRGDRDRLAQARLALHALDRAREHPRVEMAQRLLAPGLENDAENGGLPEKWCQTPIAIMLQMNASDSSAIGV
jgi:hypothetical protein